MILKKILLAILRVLCWVGFLLAMAIEGFILWFATLSDQRLIGPGNLTMQGVLTSTYVLALLVFSFLIGVSAFRIYYRHHQPTIRHAKLRIMLSIFSFITVTPTAFFLIKFQLFLGSLIDWLLIPTMTISLYILSGYVFGKTFLTLNQMENQRG